MRYALLLTVLCLSCGGSSTPEPTPAPTATDGCITAGQHLEQVCPQLAKTPAGKSFADFCHETRQNGVTLHLGCLKKAKDCTEANTCTEGGR